MILNSRYFCKIKVKKAGKKNKVFFFDINIFNVQNKLYEKDIRIGIQSDKQYR